MKCWISLCLAVIVSVASQMLLKRGATKQHKSFLSEYFNPWVISGYLLLIGSTLLIIFAYRGVDYKNGPVIEALGYLLIMFLSRIFFGEKITKKKLIGNLIILAGVIVFYL